MAEAAHPFVTTAVTTAGWDVESTSGSSRQAEISTQAQPAVPMRTRNVRGRRCSPFASKSIRDSAVGFCRVGPAGQPVQAIFCPADAGFLCSQQ